MKNMAIALSLLSLAACSTVAPNNEMKYGDAVRGARIEMTLHPDAGKTPDSLAGMDGMAAREAIVQYQDSFKTPPPAAEVINIGGGLKTGNGLH
jgi:hypothetical protein